MPWCADFSFLQHSICCLVLRAIALAFNATAASGATVTPGSLISSGQADQLDSLLGLGTQDFTRIFSGIAGVATAAQFHAAADGAGPTFTVYNIDVDGGTALIGGYASGDWGGTTGLHADPDAFIFNLTTGELQDTQVRPDDSLSVHPEVFANFGSGHDIFVGFGILGTCNGNAAPADCNGYSYSHSYDPSQGQITVAGDTGGADGSSGLAYNRWRVLSMDVYTVTSLTPVPLPAGLPLLIAALGLMGLSQRRRQAWRSNSAAAMH